MDLNLIKITKLGRYLINLPILNPFSCLEENEKFTRQVINPELERILEIKLTYYSVTSFTQTTIIDIDDVPFYTEPNDDEWNYSNRDEDY